MNSYSQPPVNVARDDAVRRFNKWLNEHTLVMHKVRYCGLSSLSRQATHDHVKLGTPYTSLDFKMRNNQHALFGLVVGSDDSSHARRQVLVVVTDIEHIADEQSW